MRYLILELALDGTILELVRNENGELMEWSKKEHAETYAKGCLAFDYRIIEV